MYSSHYNSQGIGPTRLMEGGRAGGGGGGGSPEEPNHKSLFSLVSLYLLGVENDLNRKKTIQMLRLCSIKVRREMLVQLQSDHNVMKK